MVSSILPKNERNSLSSLCKGYAQDSSFFGRIKETIICFRDLLTFNIYPTANFDLIRFWCSIFKQIRTNPGTLFPQKSFGHSYLAYISIVLLKVSKVQKQNNKFSHLPKNQQNFVHFFALVSKSGWNKKLKTLDCFK